MSPLDEDSPGDFWFAGDWHQNIRWATTTVGSITRKKKKNTILHLGDFLGFGWSMTPYLDDLDEACQLSNTQILFIDGNHEDHPYLNGLERDERGVAEVRTNIHHLGRGTRWEWEGLRFCALGGAVSVDQKWRTEHVDWFREEVLSHKQIMDTVAGGETDILLTHDCPAGVTIPDLRPGWPIDALQKAMAHRQDLRYVVDNINPSHIFHGHYHTRYSQDVYFNTETQTRCLVNGLAEDGTDNHDNLIYTSVAELKADSAKRRLL
jgi:Icc-related predicted phosphoesterase